MLKKAEKDFNNKFGIEVIDDNYKFNKPCLLTVVPITLDHRTINGYLTQLLYILQMRSINNNSNYTIKDMPFDLISFENRENKSEKIIKYIPKNNFEKAKEFMRNINILSYCNGNNETARMLYKIHDYLEEIGYKKEDIEEIMKEIFVIQIVDNHYEYNNIVPIPYATTVIIQDIYDFENDNHVLDFNSDNPFISTMQINGIKYILYKSFGEGSLYEEEREHVFKDDYIKAPVINNIIALYIIKALSASINNVSKQNISIYKELQEIIKKALEYVKNKNIEELTREEMDELNKILFVKIREIFKDNIPYEELSLEERKYLNEKDLVIYNFNTLNREDIFEKYKRCIKEITEILYIYNNHIFGEVIGSKYLGNSGIKVDVTREDEINSKLEILERHVQEFYMIFDNIKYPENISIKIKSELIDSLSFLLNDLKNKISSKEFQLIINEILNRDSKLKM